MNMKVNMKFIIIAVVGLVVILTAFAVVRRTSTSSPARLIVGSWEASNGDYFVFERNGIGRDCCGSIRYRIDSDNALVIIYNIWNEETILYWAGNSDNAHRNNWYISNNRLYLYGQRFNRR